MGRNKKSNLAIKDSLTQVIEPSSSKSGISAQSVDGKREDTRHQIAYSFIVGYFIIIILAFVVSLAKDFKINDLKDMLITTSGILSGPLGFILGFYYKSSKEG